MTQWEEPNKNHVLHGGEFPTEKDGAKMEGLEGKGGSGETGEVNKDDFTNAEFSSTQSDIRESYLKEMNEQKANADSIEQGKDETAASSVEQEKDE